MKNKIYKIASVILATMLGIFILFLAQDVSQSAASPLYNPATTTPNPTEIPEPDWYWSHEVVNLTRSHPGTIGAYLSEVITVPAAEDIEALVWKVSKQCPSTNNHWAKGSLKNTDGGSWGVINQQQTCGVTTTGWMDEVGGESYADSKTEVTTRFGDLGDTGQTTTYAKTDSDYVAITDAGTNGDPGYTATLNIYYLHYGTEGACADDIEISSEPFAEGTIDATLEEGLTEELASGGNYAIEISGGPWDDGSVDTRYDAAYSWDGVDWEILAAASDEIGCVEDLETGGQRFYIEAQSDTLYLRVNDEADAFDNNADDLDYKLYGVVGSGETGCGSNYTLGTKVFEEEWLAHFEDWQDPGTKSWPALVDDDCCYFENYDIYRILIPHTFEDPSDGYGSKAQLKPLLGGSWVDLDTHPQTVCVEDHDLDEETEEGWTAYYFESPEDFTSYAIRAKDLQCDLDVCYDNNLGGFEVEVYTATYNPPVASCAAAFDEGPLIQTIRVDSYAENGIRIPDPLFAYMRDDEGGLLAGTAYMIEEPASWAGFTPVDSDTNYFDWQISSDRSTWFDIEDFAGCISPIDTHHNKYFFDADASEYYIRAKDYDGDGSWTDQPGWISLNLYYANDLRTSPDDNGDCPNLALGDALYSGSVSSTDLDGGFLPDILQPGHLYGIQLTTPPWTDNSVDQKAAQIKVAGGSEWNDFEDWEGAFCSEKDGNDWPLNWIQALDERYLLRADDSIGDNSGWVNYTIYEADWITEPIYASCEGEYSPITFADFPALDPEIPAQWRDGQLVQDFYLRQGVYKLTTEDGPWSDIVFAEAPETSYDLEISFYNGQLNTWQALDVAADCIVTLSDGNHVRAYFTIEEGYDSFVRVRVANADELWVDNMGSMSMAWQYSSVGIDPDDPWDPYSDPGSLFQSGGCDLVCVVPPSILNIPAWLEYFRCQLVVRLSFCPYHITVISAMADLFYDREPFGSMQEMGQSFGLVRGQVEQYQWSEDQGGDPPDVEYPENFLFASPDGGGASIPIVGDDTIWGSGEINILDYSAGEFDQTCTNNLAASLGSRLSAPICFAFNIIDDLGLSSWFQFFWDISMLIALSMYFQNRWLKPMSG